MKPYITRLRGTPVLLAAVIITLLRPTPVEADAFFLPFDKIFSGGSPTSTNVPWADAYFQDVVPGTVRLSVTNLMLTGTENVDQLYLNLRPSLNPTNLVFSLIGSSSNFVLPTISTSTDNYKADGDGKYDILFGFSTGAPTNRFINNEYIVYQISGIPGLTASDFSFLSLPAGGSGPFYGAIHIQNTQIGEDSGWASADHVVFPNIPEPGAATVGLLGLISWFGFRGFRGRNKASRL